MRLETSTRAVRAAAQGNRMPPERGLGTLGDQVPFRVGVIAPQRQMRCRGGHIKVALAAQDERENAILRIEEFAEVVAAKFRTRQLPPAIEGIVSGLQPKA